MDLSSGVRTLDDLAREKGVRVYDSALPKGWVDDVYQRTGEYPVGHFVWSYDGPGVFGEPVAIDAEGEAILASFR